MLQAKFPFAGALVLGACLLAVGGRVFADDDPPKFITENKNTLIKTHKEKLKVTASTFFPNWEPEKLIDGKLDTSWFSDSNDSAAKESKPWVTITFPEDVTVTRVTVAGNREPDYLEGYSVLKGKIVFLDADDKELMTETKDGVGKQFDFEFKPKDAVKKVRSIKFLAVKDQGDKNCFGDIALGEILIE